MERPSAPQGDLRVSDQDRDGVLDLLSRHAAAGRLTLDEHEERAAKALASKTRADLAVLTRDLPEEVTAAPSRRKPARWLVAIMGGSHRRGRFRLATTVNAIAVMGGDDIDLREAEIDSGEIVLNAISIMG